MISCKFYKKVTLNTFEIRRFYDSITQNCKNKQSPLWIFCDCIQKKLVVLMADDVVVVVEEKE